MMVKSNVRMIVDVQHGRGLLMMNLVDLNCECPDLFMIPEPGA